MLKSINLKLDAHDVSRISHFRPTSKSVALIEKLFTKNYSFMVSAPYGSGKSITSAFMLHLIENRSSSKILLDKINKKISSINHSIHEKVSARLNGDQHGLVITLYGYLADFESNFSDALLTSIERLNLQLPLNTLSKINDLSKSAHFFEDLSEVFKSFKGYIDHIVIIWDEFGAHLEGLIENKQTRSLTKVQDLAALASRSYGSFGYPNHLFCLQHQSLMTYTEGQPRQIREEWSKVAGRFDSVEFIDDSQELIELLSDLYEDILNQKNEKTFKITSSKLSPYLEKLEKDAPQIQVSFDILQNSTLKAKHLSPLNLILLPRVSARLAQNERTLFDYLTNITTTTQELGLDHLYDYFEPLMRFDKSIGGTYRLYLLTLNALKSAKSDLEVSIIKTASLLSYALAGYTIKVTKTFLILAVRGVTRFKSRDVKHAINNLLERKLLLHRIYTDEIGLWQGSNVDLKERLKYESQEISQSFELVSFLRDHFPLSYTSPIIYNFEKSINRSIKNRYISSSHLKSVDHIIENHLDERTDVLVFYIISPSELSETDLQTLRHQLQDLDPKVVFAVPRLDAYLLKAAQEYMALQRLKTDESFINQDPVILDEIHEIEQDTFKYLSTQVRQSFNIDSSTTFWISSLAQKNIETSFLVYKTNNAPEYQRFFYIYFMGLYSKTPIINNEILNRTKTSASSINIRKKLISSILEHSERPNLGFNDGHEGGQASSLQSLYRTLLLQTKLYTRHHEGWRFSEPEEINHPLFSEFISIFKQFFQYPTKDNQLRYVSDLFKKLQSPPYGVRSGILPVYFAAAFKAYGKLCLILQDDLYLEDIKPSDVEQICKTPERYSVRVLEMSSERENYLHKIIETFAPEKKHDQHQLLLKEAYDALVLWYQELLEGPKTTKYLSRDHKKLRSIVKRVKNPFELLFLNIPEWAGLELSDPMLIAKLVEFKDQIHAVEINYQQMASEYLSELLKLDNENETQWLTSIHQWSTAFPTSWVNELDQIKAKILLNTTRRLFESRLALMNALTAGVFDLMIKRWTDTDVDRFKMEIRGLIDYIESKALDKSLSGELTEETLPIFQKLLESRLQKYLTAYKALTSRKNLQDFLNTTLKGD